MQLSIIIIKVLTYIFHFLLKALEEARKINNRLEAAQALAVSSSSQVWRQNARNGHFLSWNDSENSFRTSWHKSLYKIAAQSL